MPFANHKTVNSQHQESINTGMVVFEKDESGRILTLSEANDKTQTYYQEELENHTYKSY